MPRLPRYVTPDEEALLEQDADGRAELARIRAENDRVWPEPELGDILELKQRLENERQKWVERVGLVRTLRFNEDVTPQKWRDRLNIPADRRFHTNHTGNEINRVVAMLGRNPPRVTVPSVSDSNTAIQRAEKQGRWSQEWLPAVERDRALPVWARGDDAATETGQGGFEWFMNERWDRVEKLIDQIDPEAPDPQLDKQIEEAKKQAGLPFSVRPIDSLSLLFEEDDWGISCALIVERKPYRQVYRALREKLDGEALEKAQLPVPGSRAWPESSRLVRYYLDGQENIYDATPEAGDLVEVIRYYDRRWLCEVVAGRIVSCEEHHLPGVPVFPQFGKVTSNANTEYMLQGVTFGMVSQELALNDLFTLFLDTSYTYGRPFPVVETAVDGQALLDREGQPIAIKLNDPSEAPQLGPGQKIADAFGGFRGNIEGQLLQQIESYWQMSGLNPIAQGESPGADPSGFALNTLNAGAQALYESILDNKCRTLGMLIDFTRIAIRDTIRETVYLSVPSADGRSVDYLPLGPDDIDEVPSRVYIDPKSDMQRLAVISMLSTANQQGYIPRRTVQTLGLTGIVEDPDEADKEILFDQMKLQALPMIVQSVVQQVMRDAFPELFGPPGGPPVPPPGGPPEGPNGTGPQDLQQQGVTPPRGGSVGNPAPKPAVSQANRGRAGQQPANQGVPALG